MDPYVGKLLRGVFVQHTVMSRVLTHNNTFAILAGEISNFFL